MKPRKDFWSYVNRRGPGGCWLWTGGIAGSGYGSTSDPETNRTRRAHRVAWERTNGAIPRGMCVCHRCDIRLCVNPAHLFLATQAENLRDMKQKRRHQHGERHHAAKLSPKKAAAIRRMVASGRTRRSVAREYGVAHETINAVVNGRTWNT